MTTPSKSVVTGIKNNNIAANVEKVRSSHAAIVQGIATHAEKHRQALDAKRDKVRQDNLIK